MWHRFVGYWCYPPYASHSESYGVCVCKSYGGVCTCMCVCMLVCMTSLCWLLSLSPVCPPFWCVRVRCVCVCECVCLYVCVCVCVYVISLCLLLALSPVCHTAYGIRDTGALSPGGPPILVCVCRAYACVYAYVCVYVWVCVSVCMTPLCLLLLFSPVCLLFIRLCLTPKQIKTHYVMSHTWRHITRHTHIWVMSHTWRSHVVLMNESCRHLMNESRRTHKWVISHIWRNHVTHYRRGARRHEWVTWHIWRSDAWRSLWYL